MGEEEQEHAQKKKKKKQAAVLETETGESELLPQLVEALDELEHEKKNVDIQVCPKCKSPLVRRVGSMVGDMSAHLGFTPPKYECGECGWRERTVLKATNKPTTVRDVVIMKEAKDADVERKQKEEKTENRKRNRRFFHSLF
jgi:Zn-finger nucleic acid-binding protein